MILTSTRVAASRFADQTGWEPKPEGLCRGEVCVPAPGALGTDGTIDVKAAASRLGMPLVHDEAHGLWALGPATLGGHALTTAAAADPELVDRQGRPFRLSSLRGRKIIMVAWSTY
jgi:hypothetical protein